MSLLIQVSTPLKHTADFSQHQFPSGGTTKSKCFTKHLPACVLFTRVVTLLYQGAAKAIPTSTMVPQTLTVLPWYNMVRVGSGLVTGLVNLPLVLVVHVNSGSVVNVYAGPQITNQSSNTKLCKTKAHQLSEHTTNSL